MEPITVRAPEAAQILRVSLDFFEDHIQPELKVIRVGRLRLIPVEELKRWSQKNAGRSTGR